MGYETQVGEKYVVTGKNISAYLNYYPPTGNNPHSRGESKGGGEFSLEGKIITVMEHVLRTDEGFTDQYGKYAPFEVVKVKVDGRDGTFYAWVVYKGIVKVALYEPPKEKPKNEAPKGAQVHVQAGQTSVVSISTVEKGEANKKSVSQKQSGEPGAPLALNLQWGMPRSNSKNLRPLYYFHTGSNIEILLGTSANADGPFPDLDIFLKERLGAEALSLEVLFWKTKISTVPVKNPGGMAGKNSEFTLSKAVKRNIQVQPSDYYFYSGADSLENRYRVKIDKETVLSVCKELECDINREKIGVALNENLVASNFLYPVLRHTLMFLPGLFGSTLSVRRRDNSIEQAWPSESNRTQTEIDLLLCNEDGVALRGALDEAEIDGQIVRCLKVLDAIEIPAWPDKDVYKTKAVISEMLLDEKYFPSVYTKPNQGNNLKLKFVNYREIPFDWRLPMNLTTADERFAKSKFPFLAKIFFDIEKTYRKIRADENELFADERLALAGHSTGGVVLHGLLSMPGLTIDNKKFSSLVKGVFYINVPTLGAPKAEQMMLNGEEEAINILIDREHLRQIAANMPITYFLAPTKGYKDPEGLDLTSTGRRERFKDAVKGYYSTYPISLYGTSSDLRTPLTFNQKLSKLADDYYDFWLQHYTKEVPSYIFHLGCFSTIASVDVPKPDFTNNAAFEMKGAGPIDKTVSLQLIPELDQGKITTANQTHFDSRDLRTLSSTKIIPVLKGEYWQWFHYSFGWKIHSIIKNQNGELEVYFHKKEQELSVVRKYFGDTTVPRYSQLGLWHKLKDSHNNIHVMPETKTVNTHTEGANTSEVWERVFDILSGKIPDGISPPEFLCPISDSLPVMMGAANETKYGLQESSAGSFVGIVQDANSNPYPAGTQVVISDAAQTSEATFYLGQGGKLEIIDMKPDTYFIKSITTV